MFLFGTEGACKYGIMLTLLIAGNFKLLNQSHSALSFNDNVGLSDGNDSGFIFEAGLTGLMQLYVER